MVRLLAVEVCFALPEKQFSCRLEVPAGSSLHEVVLQSGILAQCPQIDWGRAKIGVFGKRREPTDVVESGDRVEIYRELLADPKIKRRERVAQARKRNKKN